MLSTRKRAQRRWWVKPWVSRRTKLGASSTLLREWAKENPEVYRNHLRMTEEQFAYLLDKVTPFISKKDTWFREALSPKIKLQMTLRYLATGDNIGTLSALYRIPRSTFSRFLPEVCKAIYNALADFIMVSRNLTSGSLINS
uniref:Transposase Helix-turn-helix domain-containing protein n=1 Tax=Photinus pyralis TaxID=7054 RepID=A0A1Y1MF54_PHOPY